MCFFFSFVPVISSWGSKTSVPCLMGKWLRLVYWFSVVLKKSGKTRKILRKALIFMQNRFLTKSIFLCYNSKTNYRMLIRYIKLYNFILYFLPSGTWVYTFYKQINCHTYLLIYFFLGGGVKVKASKTLSRLCLCPW